MSFIWTEENSAGRNCGKISKSSLYSTYSLSGVLARSTQIIADVDILYCLHELKKLKKTFKSFNLRTVNISSSISLHDKLYLTASLSKSCNKRSYVGKYAYTLYSS